MGEQDPFSGMQEVRTSAIKWGKIGDWFKGTLVANDREVPNKLSPDKGMQRIYEFKMAGGSFHGINDDRSVQEEPTILEEDSFWSVFADKFMQGQLRNAKIGQIIACRYTHDKPSERKGFNATKVKKVYLGEMDPTYQGEQNGETPAL